MNKEQISLAKQEAEDAFWGTFASHFPENEWGNLKNKYILEFKEFIEKITNLWLYSKRIFTANCEDGIIFCDKNNKIKDIIYKELAFLKYKTLKLKFKKDCPEELKNIIKIYAKEVQDKEGQTYLISSSGSTVILGGGDDKY